MEMKPQTRAILTEFLEARTGQRAGPGSEWRMGAALRPLLAAHCLQSPDELAALLPEPASHRLADETVDALLNNETCFFRDGRGMRTIAADILEAMAGNRPQGSRLRVWSAGCSTGQELYSLAMGMADAGSFRDSWTLELLGTDISQKALLRAKQGVYSSFEIQRGLPVRLMLRWFEQEGDNWRVRDTLKDMVEFRQHNILHAPPAGRFDAILCRNVLLYFPIETRRRVLSNLAGSLVPDGVLMLGAGETAIAYSDRLEPIPEAAGCYRLKKSAQDTEFRATG